MKIYIIYKYENYENVITIYLHTLEYNKLHINGNLDEWFLHFFADFCTLNLWSDHIETSWWFYLLALFLF